MRNAVVALAVAMTLLCDVPLIAGDISERVMTRHYIAGRTEEALGMIHQMARTNDVEAEMEMVLRGDAIVLKQGQRVFVVDGGWLRSTVRLPGSADTWWVYNDAIASPGAAGARARTPGATASSVPAAPNHWSDYGGVKCKLAKEAIGFRDRADFTRCKVLLDAGKPAAAHDAVEALLDSMAAERIPAGEDVTLTGRATAFVTEVSTIPNIYRWIANPIISGSGVKVPPPTHGLGAP